MQHVLPVIKIKQTYIHKLHAENTQNKELTRKWTKLYMAKHKVVLC